MVIALVSGSSSLGSSPGWAHCVVCSWVGHATLTESVSTQVHEQMGISIFNAGGGGGVTLQTTSIIPFRGGKVEVFLVTSCCRNRDQVLWELADKGYFKREFLHVN